MPADGGGRGLRRAKEDKHRAFVRTKTKNFVSFARVDPDHPWYFHPR